MSKTLVAYFSASGVTARAAEEIAAAVGADLYEIRPGALHRRRPELDEHEEPQHRGDERPGLPPRRAGCGRGAVRHRPGGLSHLVGREPRIVDTFLESHDFSGKTMIPFATSGGSAMPPAERHLREQDPCPHLGGGPAGDAPHRRGLGPVRLGR